jgi:hypothetical protein
METELEYITRRMNEGVSRNKAESEYRYLVEQYYKSYKK